MLRKSATSLDSKLIAVVLTLLGAEGVNGQDRGLPVNNQVPSRIVVSQAGARVEYRNTTDGLPIIQSIDRVSSVEVVTELPDGSVLPGLVMGGEGGSLTTGLGQSASVVFAVVLQPDGLWKAEMGNMSVIACFGNVNGPIPVRNRERVPVYYQPPVREPAGYRPRGPAVTINLVAGTIPD